MSDETMDVVVSPTSKEAIEQSNAAKESVANEPTIENSTVPDESQSVDSGSPETADDKKDEENSVIRQMRKQLKLQQKQIAELKQVQVQPEPRPQRENFNTDAEYIQAEVQHQLKSAQVVGQQSPGVFETKFNEAVKTHSDFKEALEDIDHVMFTPEAQKSIREAVETLTYGSDVLYHIAKNPDLAEELSLLPPAAFAARLGDIHGDIRRSKTNKQVSKAPAPISPVSGSTKTEKSYDDMSMEEYRVARRKEKEAARLARYGV
jgi:hypothetical protein